MANTPNIDGAKKILFTATIARVGWEMDNDGWIVEMQDGSIKAFTTNHGGLCEWSIDAMQSQLKTAADSATSIGKAISLLSLNELREAGR